MGDGILMITALPCGSARLKEKEKLQPETNVTTPHMFHLVIKDVSVSEGKTILSFHPPK